MNLNCSALSPNDRKARCLVLSAPEHGVMLSVRLTNTEDIIQGYSSQGLIS